MIVKLYSLVSSLDSGVKAWAHLGCSRTTLYRALSGQRINRRNALAILRAARKRFGNHLEGIEIAGEVHYGSETLETFQSRIDELRAENARLRADNVTLSRIAYRRIVVGGVANTN